MVRSDLAYSPVSRTAIHTQRNVALLYSSFNPENILTTDVEAIFPSLQAQPGGSHASDLNPQLYHSSHAQNHDIFPSSTLTNASVDPPRCGGFHQMEPIVTNY